MNTQLHDAHVGCYILSIVDAEIPAIDYTVKGETHIRHENWRLVRAGDDGNDAHADKVTKAGLPPASPRSCLYRLASRVTLSRVLSKAERAKVQAERATFCIRPIIEQALNDNGMPKRKGRPSKAEMMRRAKAGI